MHRLNRRRASMIYSPAGNLILCPAECKQPRSEMVWLGTLQATRNPQVDAIRIERNLGFPVLILCVGFLSFLLLNHSILLYKRIEVHDGFAGEVLPDESLKKIAPAELPAGL